MLGGVDVARNLNLGRGIKGEMRVQIDRLAAMVLGADEATKKKHRGGGGEGNLIKGGGDEWGGRQFGKS